MNGPWWMAWTAAVAILLVLFYVRRGIPKQDSSGRRRTADLAVIPSGAQPQRKSTDGTLQPITNNLSQSSGELRVRRNVAAPPTNAARSGRPATPSNIEDFRERIISEGGDTARFQSAKKEDASVAQWLGDVVLPPPIVSTDIQFSGKPPADAMQNLPPSLCTIDVSTVNTLAPPAVCSLCDGIDGHCTSCRLSPFFRVHRMKHQPTALTQQQLDSVRFRLVDVSSFSEKPVDIDALLRGLSDRDSIRFDDCIVPRAYFVESVDNAVARYECLRLCRKALKIGQKLSDGAPYLTACECAAIYFWTLESTVQTQLSPYFLLNRALRSNKYEATRGWAAYIFLLLNGLEKLKAHPATLAYRAVPASVQFDKKPGDIVQFRGFSATTTERSVLPGFLGPAGGTILQIALTRGDAKSIQQFSAFPSENELLLPPNLQVKVDSVQNMNDGIQLVMCQQL